MSLHPETDNGDSENMEPRTITFKTFYWKYEDTENDELEIHIGGRTANNESVHCIVKNFTPYVYLELPKKIRWNKAKCIAVFEYFKKTMKSEGPLSMHLLQKFKLKHKELVNCMRLTFPTQKAAAAISRKCKNARNGMFIDGVGMLKAGDLIVHETNIDPIMKFTASKKLKLASFITVKETILPEEVGFDPEERKYSSADIDLYADWLDIEDFTPKELIVVRPKYISFDIECYSINHNSKLPDPQIPGNFIFSIACTTGYFGQTPEETVLFTLFNPKNIKGVKVIRCKDEKELLIKWRAYVESENPDLFITYNGMKFDWGYMIARAEYLGIYLKFCQITRIVGRRADLMETKWSSSAYGEQEFRYLDPMGRTNLDVLLEIERNYKLPQYGLNATGKHFLGEEKDDITPRQLFMLVQLTIEITPLVEDLCDGIVDRNERIRIKKEIQNILPMRRCHGVVKDYRKTLMSSKTGKQFRSNIREALTLTGKYNVQDTVLPVRLAEKLNLWTTMEETSNCQHVPMSYLHTRGQQVKVLAQVFRETIFNDIIIPHKERLKDGERVRYEGAVVIEANPGDYDNVICTDFASLYPSMMIAYNICHTTLVPDGDPYPDDQCHVLKISSHIGCCHDVKKRKKKKEDILCHDRVYRFKKVIYHPDGTRENEGVFPKMERNLMAERKVKKKEMAKLEAKLKMAEGLAEPEDIAFYKKMGWEIIEKGSLTDKELEILKVNITVLNAQQLAIKISCNSMYGTLGAQNGPIPLVEGAETVTAMGRDLIIAAIDYTLKNFKGCKLVYGDTDSAMLTFPGLSTEESFKIGDEIASTVTHYLITRLLEIEEDHQVTNTKTGEKYRIDKYPRKEMEKLSDEDKILIYKYDSCPIKLEFENLYKRYLLLTKKRYVAYAVNRKGKIVSKVKKGVVLARRDNCMYLRDTYALIKDAILERLTKADIMHILYDQVQKLFTRQIPSANLILYLGVKTIMHYAKRKETKKGNTVVERVYLDEDGEPIDDPIGPLDPRLIYPNLPQVLLAMKMLRRGDDVPPNTRLEFLYCRKDDATHQGEKAEDYTFYKENKSILNLKPDYLHYVEKQLSRPLKEILDVKFPPEKIPHEKLDDHLTRLIDELDDLQKHRVNSVKVYERTIKSEYSQDYRVGWPAYGSIKNKKKKIPVGCKKCSDRALKDPSKRCSKHVSAGPKGGRTYEYKKKAAQVQFILDSMARKKANPKKPNEICPIKYNELYIIALRWKSRYILDKLYAQHGLRKRPAKRATQTGEKLRIKTKDEFNTVFTTKKVGKYPKGTLLTLKDIHEHEYQDGRRKKKSYTYDVEGPKGDLIKGVPRASLTTWYHRDGSLMKDILLARSYYMCIVEEIEELACPVVFDGVEKRKVINYDDVYDD